MTVSSEVEMMEEPAAKKTKISNPKSLDSQVLAGIKQKNDFFTSRITNNVISNSESHHLAVALPASVLNNIHTLELKTVLISQIARYCAIFRVDEIIIFDDFDLGFAKDYRLKDKLRGPNTRSLELLRKLLEYSNCPQYLRKHLFVLDQDLSYASLLHPLATPHHMKADDFSHYRQGVTLNRFSRDGNHSLAYCGQNVDVEIDKKLKPGLLVTVKCERLRPDKGVVVAPKQPKMQGGYYWGFEIKTLESVHALLSEVERFDLVVGTSDKGDHVESVAFPSRSDKTLVVFGGPIGLETAFKNDPEMAERDTREVFPYYINCFPKQGSRTIRTEEALPIVLTSILAKINV